MRTRNLSLRLAVPVILATTLGGAPLDAAGFSLIFEQSAKAMGMAGAFTATADEPSAMFFNVGGLAFLLAGISRHRKYGEDPEADERSRKIGAYGLSYAWLTGIFFMAWSVTKPTARSIPRT